LLDELISLIDSAAIYRANHEAEINIMRIELEEADDASQEFDACMALASAYDNYSADSCLSYYIRAKHVAEAKLADAERSQIALFGQASILTRIGHFTEAYILLSSVDSTKLDKPQLCSYYYRQLDLYHGLYVVLDDEAAFRPGFVAKYNYYRDAVMSLYGEDSPENYREAEKKYARRGDFEKALRFNDLRYESFPESPVKGKASVLYDRYSIYNLYMGRPLQDHIELLLESAILDLRTANQNIASLRKLESWLLSINYLKEAKSVSDYYYDTMRRFGSRTRMLDGMGLAMDINDEYSTMLIKSRRDVQYALMCIIFLLLILLFIFYMEMRSRQKIKLLNKNLYRSGLISKGYVLGFFQLYSSYLSRLLALRSKINTNLRKGNTAFVRDLTDPSKDFINDELKTMYSNFDKAFLDIFPDYVEKFNALLKPEYRFQVKASELLNMDMRIFAIIKLGITDSQTISDLLHCSIKTVYNKRSGINARLAVDRDDFMDKLAEI